MVAENLENLNVTTNCKKKLPRKASFEKVEKEISITKFILG